MFLNNEQVFQACRFHCLQLSQGSTPTFCLEYYKMQMYLCFKGILVFKVEKNNKMFHVGLFI